MEEKTLIKKGAVVFIHSGGTGNLPIELVIGEDILRNDDVYVNDNGTMKVHMEDIEIAVEDYMLDDYYANDYYFDVCEEEYE